LLLPAKVIAQSGYFGIVFLLPSAAIFLEQSTSKSCHSECPIIASTVLERFDCVNAAPWHTAYSKFLKKTCGRDRNVHIHAAVSASNFSRAGKRAVRNDNVGDFFVSPDGC